MKLLINISLLFCLASCASKPHQPTDVDWDYVFPDDESHEYCEMIIEEDCSYYPPYYY